MMKPRLTVFTPTYNRAELLHLGYEALKRQSSMDFLWLIIDDGSTDGTRKLVEQWMERQNGFQIQYRYKENGGLHTGYNEAIKYSDTELMVCIDSDDFMPDDAVEKIINFWNQYGSDRYAGIVGLDYNFKGEVIGDLLPEQKSVNLIDLLTGKYPIHNGDRKNVIRTELYKQVAPQPTYKGEKNFNPHYMHLQISKNYDFLVLNENLCFVEYREGGMSNSMFKQYLSSPNSFAEIRRLYLSFPNTAFAFKLKHSIHYVSSCILSKQLKEMFKRTSHPLYTLAAVPFGVVLSMTIRFRGK